MTQPTPNAEIAASILTWTVEQRFRYFVMGVCLPMLLVVGPSYFMFVSGYKFIAIAFGAFLVICTVSSTGMAACCVAPRMGNQMWVQTTITLGLVLWLPLAFITSIATGLIALVAAAILAMAIAAVAKVVSPLYPSGSRFSIKQIFWLTTLFALFSGAVSAIVQSVQYWHITSFDFLDSILSALVWSVTSIPIMAFATFAIVSAEIKEAKRTGGQKKESRPGFDAACKQA